MSHTLKLRMKDRTLEEEEDDITQLFVPDLNNTLLQDAIKKGVKKGKEVTIHSPRLKFFLGVDTLLVSPRNGDLKVNMKPPYDFDISCSPDPFPEELLIIALNMHAVNAPEPLPGDKWPSVQENQSTGGRGTQKQSESVQENGRQEKA